MARDLGAITVNRLSISKGFEDACTNVSPLYQRVVALSWVFSLSRCMTVGALSCPSVLRRSLHWNRVRYSSCNSGQWTRRNVRFLSANNYYTNRALFSVKKKNKKQELTASVLRKKKEERSKTHKRLKRTLFNWTKQDKTHEFSRKSSFPRLRTT